MLTLCEDSTFTKNALFQLGIGFYFRDDFLTGKNVHRVNQKFKKTLQKKNTPPERLSPSPLKH